MNMQSLRDCMMRHLRVTLSKRPVILSNALHRHLCTSTDQIRSRVIGLVKKFDKIDASKVIRLCFVNPIRKYLDLIQVTGLADFQKDLSLDSLDRVELVMAFEQEFSIEIPDEHADKLKCCADVADYILSAPKQDTAS